MQENNVEILSEIEHVKRLPGMYAGESTVGNHKRFVYDNGKVVQKTLKFVPAIMKMFDEIISNSIDEAIRTNFRKGFTIRVGFDGKTFSVEDNGRGVPLKPAKGDESITMAEAAFARLRAGTNFTDEETTSIGAHGLGASLVNILSTSMHVETCDGKKKLVLQCSNNMSVIDKKITTGKKSGTKVVFTPDLKIFKIGELDETYVLLVYKRVADLAMCYPEIKFMFNGKQIKNTFKDFASMVSDDALVYSSDDCNIAVFPSDDQTHISFVNGIDTYEGGTHVEYVREQIVKQVLANLSKRFKKFKLKPSDVRNHLGVVVQTNAIVKPKFRSQTKEYITNNISQYKDAGILGVSEKFLVQVAKYAPLIDPMIETYRVKQQVADALQAKKASKALKKVIVPSHIPASSKNPREKILFVTEGDSAIGALTNVRDTKIHGGFPLRGKPLNVTKCKKQKLEILKNKEYSNLMAVIGLSFDFEPTIDTLNYGSIYILADADHDGSAITALLINFFALWPRLFDDGRIFIVDSPIGKLEKGGKVEYFYSYDEFNAAMKKRPTWESTYLKGLGSLTDDAYRDMVFNPHLKRVVLEDEDRCALSVVFGEDIKARKEWIGVKNG